MGLLSSIGGALIGAAGSLLGGERRNSAQADVAQDTNQFNAEQAHVARQFNREEAIRQRRFASREARLNRLFQQTMSNTSYRRAVRDMRKAGINPILAASRGGASTPGGNAALGVAATGPSASGVMPVFTDTITPAVNTALSATRTKSQVGLQEQRAKKTEQEVEKVKKEIDVVVQQLWNMRAIKELTLEQIEQTAELAYKLKKEAELASQRTAGVSFDNVIKEILTKFYGQHNYAAIAKDLNLDGRALAEILNKWVGRFLVGKKRQK